MSDTNKPLEPTNPAEIDANIASTPAAPAASESAAEEDLDPLAGAQAEIAILQAKVSELNDHWLRGQAEVQNARRRADDEVSKARKFAVESFAESMLPVIDSLAAGLAVKDATIEQIREGSSATIRQLTSALERHKVLAINPEPTAEGAVKFDPAKHQAISMVPSDQEANTVVAVLQKGYAINERTLRPALVTVAAPK